MSGEIKACGGCGSPDLVVLFDMGLQPLAEGTGSSWWYPLVLMRCGNCRLVQLSYIVDPEQVFRPDHPYATGNSAALRRHYQLLVQELGSTLLDGDLVVDIGANDGTLLSCYASGLLRIAVEPTDQIRKCPPGIARYQEFFTAALAQEIRAMCGTATVITACNVLAHVPDPHDFLDGVTALLGDDGLFITENHDLESVTGGLQFDTVYHEHLRYYSVASLSLLLERHGLRVTGVRPVDTHGGSFRVQAVKARAGFSSRADTAATALRAILYRIVVQRHQTVYGIGAATRATPLIHYAGIKEFISCVCEVAGSEKIGQHMPGTQIPVVDEAKLLADQPQYALLFAWHLAGDLIPKLRAAGYRGKFIVPLPVPEVIDG